LADVVLAGRYPDPQFPGYTEGEPRTIDFFCPGGVIPTLIRFLASVLFTLSLLAKEKLEIFEYITSYFILHFSIIFLDDGKPVLG
jgi:hypothetical protein